MKQYVKDLINNGTKFFIKVESPSLSEKVQKELFENGCTWGKRLGQKTNFSNSKFLYVGSWEKFDLTHSYDRPISSVYKEVSADDILASDGFEVGDKVRAFGCDGTVDLLDTESVRVSFGNYNYTWFKLDGRQSDWHKEPSLILIERPVKKFKKSFWLWTKPNGQILTDVLDENFRNVNGQKHPCNISDFTKIPGTEVTLEVEVK